MIDIRMTQIIPEIFIGDSLDARLLEPLRVAGINCVLNVAKDLDDPWLDGILSVKCGLLDGPCRYNQVDTAVNILDALLKVENNKVLVHCHAGANRAPFVVSRYLAKVNKTTWQEEFTKIKEKRSIVFMKEWMTNYL